MLAIKKQHRHKIYLIIFVLCSISIAISSLLYALRQNIDLFYTPSNLLQQHKIITNKVVRLGGLVLPHSFHLQANLMKEFVVTDGKAKIKVYFAGMLPNLFREGQYIIVNGKLLANNNFHALQVLAKHDENYRPPQLKTNFS